MLSEKPTFIDVTHYLRSNDCFIMRSKSLNWRLFVYHITPDQMKRELTPISIQDVTSTSRTDEENTAETYEPNPQHQKGVIMFGLECKTTEALTPLVLKILKINSLILLKSVTCRTPYLECLDGQKGGSTKVYHPRAAGSLFTIPPLESLYEAILGCVAPFMPGGYTWEFYASGGL